MDVLVVIPARGGSKGIPRKNLRSLAGRPLLAYAIEAAQGSQHELDIFVSSEDEEVLTLAAKLGAQLHHRDPTEAGDETTLDPVVYSAHGHASRETGKIYDVVATLQPTSPLIRSATIDAVLGVLRERVDIDTVITARDNTHLTWRKAGDRYVPNYEKRVNRQYLEPIYTETGGLLATRTRVMTASNRIGEQVDLYLLSGAEGVDIDSHDDWSLCEYHLRRRKILFVVSGYPEIGLGHVYNTLLLANDIVDHEVSFLVDRRSELAFQAIAARNFTVHMQQTDDLVKDVARLAPHVVVNDRLDTSRTYMNKLKDLGVRTVNFEDLGDGAGLADLVINAIYPEDEVLPNHYFGHRYFCLRDEFLLTSPPDVQSEVREVLLTFGGVDPNNLTAKTLSAIHSFCVCRGIRVSVVAGVGYDKYETLGEFDEVQIYRNAKNISDHMQRADVIFTSAGRTTYECASLGVPAIVLAQNERELTHFFASENYGFLNLGLGSSVPESRILEVFERVVDSVPSRKRMSELMQEVDLREGRSRVIRLIKDLVEAK